MHELLTRYNKRLRFEKKEMSHILITSLITAFILSFKLIDTGQGYVVNLIVLVIIAATSFFMHFGAQKIIGLSLGYESKYKHWLNGMLISIIICFFSYGYIPLFFTGSLWHEHISKLRVDVFRGGVKHKDLGYIAFAGPITNIVLVGLIAPIYLATKSPLIYAIIIVNLLIAVYSLLPIPTFEKLRQFKGGTTGLYLFIASRWIWVLAFVSILAYAALILLFNFFSYIIAVLIGAVITIIYYLNYEEA